jgi:hypothetical protein
MYLALHRLVGKFLLEASWDDEYASLASHTRVMLPHGAENGFDPFRGFDSLTHAKACGYLHSSVVPRLVPGEFVRGNASL